MKLKPYEKYKKSGIDWIDEIPEEWEVRRVKDVIESNKKSLSNNENPEFLLQYIDISNVGTGYLLNKPELLKFYEAPSRARRIVSKNDVIISTVRTYLKAVYYFEKIENNYVCSTGFSVLTPKRIISHFLKYLVISETFIDDVVRKSKGVSYPAITDSNLVSLIVFLPNKTLQSSIANFLDQKTSQIDKKINLLEQKLNKYEELKKTLINETVCRGLDKNVELKESGIEWIGKIPKHWEVKRLKELVSFKKGMNAGKYTNEYVKDINNFGLFPVYSGQTENDCVMATINTFEYSTDVNSIFVTTVGAKAMTTKLVSGKFTLSQNCALINLKNSRNQIEYYYYYLKILFVTERNNIPSHMQPSLRIEDLKKYKIVKPPLSEQTQIANYLDEKCNKIDKIKSAITKEISILKELRKTLINDVVTGKVKVK